MHKYIINHLREIIVSSAVIWCLFLVSAGALPGMAADQGKENAVGKPNVEQLRAEQARLEGQFAIIQAQVQVIQDLVKPITDKIKALSGDIKAIRERHAALQKQIAELEKGKKKSEPTTRPQAPAAPSGPASGAQ